MQLHHFGNFIQRFMKRSACKDAPESALYGKRAACAQAGVANPLYEPSDTYSCVDDKMSARQLFDGVPLEVLDAIPQIDIGAQQQG